MKMKQRVFWLSVLTLTLTITPAASASSTSGRGTPLVGSAPARAATATPLPPLPAAARVPDVKGHKQLYSLSCEANAAVSWAAFFGVPIDEETFIRQLPTSDNPDFGFVGDLSGPWGKLPPDGYGVHAGPVAALLRVYRLNAYAHRQLQWDDLRRQIALGQPVIVWVVGHVEHGQATRYIAPNRMTVTVARFEHTVLLTGYTADEVEIVDGKKTYFRPLAIFLESWSVLGNLAIVRGLLPTAR